MTQLKDAANAIANTLTAGQRADLTRHFVMITRFEYLFWDMGYRRQQWEV